MIFQLPQLKPGQIVRLENSPTLAVVMTQTHCVVFRDECTHSACAFSQDGEIIDGVLICNCHGAEFNLHTGAVLQGPAEEALEVFPVRLLGQALEVLL